MRVVTMLGGTDGEYTAFIPEGFLDRWALRRLARAPEFNARRPWVEIVAMLPPPPWTLVPFDHLENLRLIEHGGNATCSWLTRHGVAMLEFLERYGCDSDERPDEFEEPR